MTTTRVNKPKKDQQWLQPIHLILASGGMLGTLIGGNLLAGRSWVNSIVPDHHTDESLLQPAAADIPDVSPYSAPVVSLPNLSQLPQPIEVPNVELGERVVLLGQSDQQGIGGLQSGGSAANHGSIQLPEIPQIAQPVIPQRPQVNVQQVSLDLPEIPQVNVPQPVTSSKSSG